jgi:hypothetical protein
MIHCQRDGRVLALATRIEGHWDIADARRVGHKTRDDPRTHAFAQQPGRRRTFFDSPIKVDHDEPAATARARTFRCRDCGHPITRRRDALNDDLDHAVRIGANKIRI